MLERIIYVSRAAPRLGPAQIHDLAHTARRYNSRDGLSGALLFLDGWFAQVLEGEPGKVQACFERIARDPRHDGIDLRIRTLVHCPVFRGQAMAVCGPSDIDPGLLSDFDYREGFPVEIFPVDVLLEFILQACRPPQFRLHASG